MTVPHERTPSGAPSLQDASQSPERQGTNRASRPLRPARKAQVDAHSATSSPCSGRLFRCRIRLLSKSDAIAASLTTRHSVRHARELRRHPWRGCGMRGSPAGTGAIRRRVSIPLQANPGGGIARHSDLPGTIDCGQRHCSAKALNPSQSIFRRGLTGNAKPACIVRSP